MTLEEYFANISRIIQDLTGVDIERYEEQLLSATRSNPRLRLRFPDQALLEMSEAVLCTAGTHNGSVIATTIRRLRASCFATIMLPIIQKSSPTQITNTSEMM